MEDTLKIVSLTTHTTESLLGLSTTEKVTIIEIPHTKYGKDEFNWPDHLISTTVYILVSFYK